MARLRDNYSRFLERDAIIFAVGPDVAPAFQTYWQKESLPFSGLPDPLHRVARIYQKEVNLFKWGRMPLLCVIDRAGLIRYVHRAESMSDIPSIQNLLAVIDSISASSD